MRKYGGAKMAGTVSFRGFVKSYATTECGSDEKSTFRLVVLWWAFIYHIIK